MTKTFETEISNAFIRMNFTDGTYIDFGNLNFYSEEDCVDWINAVSNDFRNWFWQFIRNEDKFYNYELELEVDVAPCETVIFSDGEKVDFKLDSIYMLSETFEPLVYWIHPNCVNYNTKLFEKGRTVNLFETINDDMLFNM